MLHRYPDRQSAACVIWHDKHSGDWLTAFATPYPAVPDFPLCRGQNKTPRDNLLINPPLEMTVAASSIQSFQKGRMTKNAAPIPVISTEAERSGEISPSDGTSSITAGDLSTQSIMGAIPVCLPYRHAAPLEMTVAAGTPIVMLKKRCSSAMGHTFGGHVHIKYHNHSYPRPPLRHFVALFP